MGKIENVEIQSCTEYASASYRDDDGEEYEIVFVRTYNHNIGYEEKELTSVEKDGGEIDPGHPIWEEIRRHIDCEEDERWDTMLQ